MPHHNVIVLDRHRLVAEVLASGLTARGHTATGRLLADAVTDNELDDLAVLVLDAQGGWPAVQQWIARLGSTATAPRVVLMLDVAPPVSEATARRAGVGGWFARKSTLGTATTVIRTVLDGRTFFASHGRVAEVPAPRQPLTEREQQVLDGIAAGVSYAQIAERLQVSHNTVRTHASSIRTKLGVRNRSAAVAAAHGVRVVDAVAVGGRR